MKLGCNTVLFAGFDVQDALDQIAFAGYEYVELAAIKGMCEHLSVDQGTRGAEVVGKRVEAAGLTATAVEAATTDPERLARVCELAATIGIDIVNVGSGGKSGDEESTKEAIANVVRLADVARDHGCRLAVKPHVGQAIFDAATALRLTAEVDHPALGLNFDPSHLYRADEDPDDVARQWGSRIITSHFRDCASRERQVGPPPTQVPGRGTVDIPATLRALKEVGYAGPLNLEVIGAASYTLPQATSIAAETRGYLNRCLQELG
ncbi:sugar phosphate isomerase/epimerase family protein [Actinopolymorpha singaporensis]